MTRGNRRLKTSPIVLIREGLVAEFCNKTRGLSGQNDRTVYDAIANWLTQSNDCFCLLIGNIMDLPPASDETKLRAFGLMGQVVSFHIFSEDVKLSLILITERHVANYEEF